MTTEAFQQVPRVNMDELAKLFSMNADERALFFAPEDLRRLRSNDAAMRIAMGDDQFVAEVARLEALVEQVGPNPFYAYRAGIIRVSHAIGRAKLEKSLPPAHRIAEAWDSLHLGVQGTEYLVEGPTLPIVLHADLPCSVELNFTMSRRNGELRVDAAWKHDPDKRWLVGAWPDFNAYIAEMESLS